MPTVGYHTVAVGNSFRFAGPGLGQYEATHSSLSEAQRDAICHMLARAYNAGKEAKAHELRDALGVR